MAESQDKGDMRRERIAGDDESESPSRRSERGDSREDARSEDVANSHSLGGEQDPKSSELRSDRSFQSSGHSGRTDQTERGEEAEGDEDLANACRQRRQRSIHDERSDEEGRKIEGSGSVAQRSVGGEGSGDLPRWQTESDMGRGLPDGMAGRVDINGTAPQGGLSRVGKNIPNRIDRLKCIGNGQVPQCAALAWRILSKDESKL